MKIGKAMGAVAIFGLIATGCTKTTAAPVAPATTTSSSQAANLQPAAAQQASVKSGSTFPGGSASMDNGGITAIGTGKASGTPDTLTLNLGVETRAATAQGALSEASVKAQGVIDLMKSKGIEAKDITTTNVSVYPQFDDKGVKVVGYVANEGVTVKSHDIKGAGALIDAAAGVAGDAIRMNGVYFSVEDTTALYAEARKVAVARAKTQAQQLADAAGVTLGKVRIITEYGDQGGYNQNQLQAGGDFTRAASSTTYAAVPIEVGSQELAISVTMIFDIG